MKMGIVREHNLHMGGIDYIDQQLLSIIPLRNCYKCYKETFVQNHYVNCSECT